MLTINGSKNWQSANMKKCERKGERCKIHWESKGRARIGSKRRAVKRRLQSICGSERKKAEEQEEAVESKCKMNDE